MRHNEIETFCQKSGFLFHEHGSGTFGADRYWTFYKVANNNRTQYSIEYFPVRGTIKICRDNSTYQGVVESLSHLQELLKVMRIWENELEKFPGLVYRIKQGDTNILEELNSSPLSERERETLKMWFGIGTKKHSRQEIAEHFGITTQRVSQIEEKAMRRLDAMERGIHIERLRSMRHYMLNENTIEEILSKTEEP